MATSTLQREATAEDRQVRKNPILVTGSHRSGSTWVGRMLAKAPGVGYIHEPFSLGTSPGVASLPLKYWFHYVSDHNADEFYPQLKRTLDFRYDLSAEIRAIRKPRHVGRIVRHRPRFWKHRAIKGRPLMKDPLAFFSAEWLASTFDMDVVLLVRHPAAFASSIMRFEWNHDFTQFLDQPEMMRDLLTPFEDDIRRMAATRHPIIEQAALLWNIINTITLQYRDRHPEWLLFRHEDLSRDPLAGFESMMRELKIPYTDKTLAEIEAHTSSKNPKDAPSGGDTLVRDSKANIANWKKRLSEKEIELIRTSVEDVSRHFYADSDW